MTVQQFQNLLRDAARYSWHSEQLYRFNGFAMYRRPVDIESENWGKNILDKDSIFSRRWEATGKRPSTLEGDYPALFASYNSFTKNKKNQRCYEVEVLALYPNFDRLGPETPLRRYCKVVRVEDIYPAMIRLVDLVFNYLENVFCVTVAGKEIWQNKQVLDKVGDAYVVDPLKTAKYQQMFIRENTYERKGGFIDDFGTSNLCGVKQIINFCEDCEDHIFNLKDDCCDGWDGQ